jgi:hypothetical protein
MSDPSVDDAVDGRLRIEDLPNEATVRTPYEGMSTRDTVAMWWDGGSGGAVYGVTEVLPSSEHMAAVPDAAASIPLRSRW